MNRKYFLLIFSFIIIVLGVRCDKTNEDNNIINEDEKDYSHCETVIYNQLYKIDYLTVDQLMDSISYSSTPQKVNEVGKIYFYKDLIFINKPRKGFHIFNKSNPSDPRNIGFLKVLGSIDIAIKNDILYVDIYRALVSIDITDLFNPKPHKDKIIYDAFPYQNIYSDNYYNTYPKYIYSENIKDNDTLFCIDKSSYNIDKNVAIVLGWKKIDNVWKSCYKDACYNNYSYDIAIDETASDDGSATNTSESTGTGGSLARFLILEDYLYALNSSQINLFSIDNTTGKLSEWSKVSTDVIIETIFGINNYIFIGSTTGMLMYDISDVSNPQFVSSVQHFQSCDPVVADQTHAFVTLRGGRACGANLNELQVIDIQDIQNPEVIANYNLNGPYGLGLDGNILFVCDGKGGIKIFDVTDRKKPKIVSSILDIFAYDVILKDNIATFITENGLLLYTYKKDESIEPKKLGEITF